MDWTTFIISLLGSGLITTIINGIINQRTQITAIKESGIYKKRMEILDKIIKKMENVNFLTNSLLLPTIKYSKEHNNEIQQNFFISLENFTKFYKRHRHYLSKQISDELDTLNNKYFSVYLDSVKKKIIKNNKKIDKKTFKNKMNLTFTDLVKMHTITDLRNQQEKIIKEFRKIIGVK